MILLLYNLKSLNYLFANKKCTIFLYMENILFVKGIKYIKTLDLHLK